MNLRTTFSSIIVFGLLMLCGVGSVFAVTSALPKIATNPTLGPWTISSKVYGSPSFQLKPPTSTSKGGWSYASSDLTVATVNGGALSIVGAGTTTITATQAPAGTSLAASTNATFIVTPLTPKVGAFAIPTKKYGSSPFTLSPPTSPSLGQWSYESGNSLVASVSNGIVSINGFGVTVITARQDSFGNFGSVSKQAIFKVVQGSPILSPFFIPTQLLGNGSFNLIPPTSTSTGTWSYASSKSNVASVNGSLVTLKGTGTTTITAIQSATANWLATKTNSQLIVVPNGQAPVLGAFTIPTAIYGSYPFTITPPSSTSPGPWSYISDNTNVATVTSGVVTVIGAGTASITATQEASGIFTTIRTNAILTVNPATPVLGAFAIPGMVYGNPPIAITSPSSPSSGAWSYISDNPGVATISGDILTINGAGTATITASQSASGNYATARTNTTVTVTAATPVLGAFMIPPTVYGSAPIAITPPSSPSSGAWSYMSDNPGVATVSGNILTINGAGTATITASQVASGNYSIARTSTTMTVKPAIPVLGEFTIPSTVSGSAPFAITAPSSTSSGVWRYTSDNPSVATISGNVLTIVGTGTATITATQQAVANWLEASTTSLLVVTTSGPTPEEVESMLKGQASNNALLALSNALTQLQVEAGPDQRVTATADIYNVNSTNTVTQPYWTGVWKTYNPDWANDPARQPWNRVQPLDVSLAGQSTPVLRQWSTNADNMVWLVSGASNNSEINPFSFGPSSASNTIILATGWGANSNQISVPLVSITNDSSGAVTGHYGYWVSDEGVKAKINITETNLNKNPINSPGLLVSSLIHYLGGAAPYLPSVMTNFGLQGASDLRTNPELSNITNFSDLKLLDPSYAGISNNTLSADFTLLSYGVLCDVRRGGLKQDLTAAMESSVTNPAAFNSLLYRSGRQIGNLSDNDSLMAYRANSSALPVNLSSTLSLSSNSCIDGLRWQSIYNFYNLYKTSMPQSPSIQTTMGSSPVGIGVPSTTTFNTVSARAPFFQDPAGSVLSYSHLTPTVIADSIRAELGVTNMMTMNGSRYFFQVSYYPILVLYNPYSVAINVSGTSFSISKNIAGSLNVGLSCKNSSTGMDYLSSNNLGISTNNLWPSIVTSVLTNSSFFQTSSGNPIHMSITNPLGALLLPGETKVYGIYGTNYNYSSTTLENYAVFSAAQGRKLISTSNLTSGYGFGGLTVTLTNWVGSPYANDIVSLTYSGRTSISYNNIKYSPQSTWNSGPYSISTWPNTNVYNYDLPGILFGTSMGNFPGTATTTTIAQLVNNPVTILGATERLKGTVAANQYSNFIGVQTNIPTFSGNSCYLNGPRSSPPVGNYNPVTETCVSISSGLNLSFVNNLFNSTTVSWFSRPVGDDNPNILPSTNNNTSMVLRDIPIAPMTSLGQLMHLDESYNGGLLTGTYNLFPFTVPSMSIGGSLCCPETGPFINSIFYNRNSSANAQWYLIMDHSFVANEALFDTYFFSTVPPLYGFSWGSGINAFGTYSNKLTPISVSLNQALPNSRMVFYKKDHTDPSVTDLQDENKAAANLLVNGAFNVNSTSVAAWKALLTSLNGQIFSIYNFVSGQFQNRNVTNPFLRFWSVGRFNTNDPWDGTRSLSDQQVTALAQEIVNQVRKRGPFLSMGDFLNRRMAPTNSLSYSSMNLMGALQAAIENTQTNGLNYDVNSNIHNKPSVCTSNNFNAPLSWSSVAGQIYPATNGLMVNMSQIVTNTATGIPGYLMQQDLVQAFAPVMTVRSDTFRVRVYGDSTAQGSDTSNKFRVYGEAVVQRVPDYYDQTDSALTMSGAVRGITAPLGDATPVYGPNGPIVNAANQSYGRAFKIISFRWLTPDEI